MKNALGELMRTPRTAKNVESGGSWVETSSISKQTEEGREQQQQNSKRGKDLQKV